MIPKQLRQAARQTLRQLQYKFTLFFIPVSLQFLSWQLSADRSNKIAAGLDITLTDYLFPILVSLALALTSLAVTFNLVIYLRSYTKQFRLQDVFITFNHKLFLRLLWLYVFRSIAIMLWILPMIFGYLTADFGFSAFLESITFNPLAIISNPLAWIAITISWFGMKLTLFSFFMLCYKSIAYSQADLLLMDHITHGNHLPTRIVLMQSSQLIKGNKWNYILLNLSFIVWLFLIILTNGISSIFVIPYYLTTMAHFYQNLIKKETEK